MKAIFVGYADKHAGNVYRFINPNTNKIILSRDVKWLERKYGDEKMLSHQLFQMYIKISRVTKK